MSAGDLRRHVAQLDDLARDLSALGLHAEVEIQSGRRGRWLVTPGVGVRTISSVRRWRHHGLHVVRLGAEVLHLTTDDLELVVLAAADLAVHGRPTLGLGSAGEYCLTSARPILVRHPSRPELWWFTTAGELAPLGGLETGLSQIGRVSARLSRAVRHDHVGATAVSVREQP
ncbi:hypothetical protein [Aeromicrobium endophyticum]|uniref:Uncharacterized protein n=1 Tax=Aeromicrobium endophyticum TaxID=2292704 RepID=A0A371PAL2_9ACTN|nr:hypothetical protein [Aeromicrobium endophyticum]REK72995.1 hypothetical protein DX116_05235 [Aeromicrobium endophyticum]